MAHHELRVLFQNQVDFSDRIAPEGQRAKHCPLKAVNGSSVAIGDGNAAAVDAA